MRTSSWLIAAAAVAAAPLASAQTFRRLGTCPQLGCVFPPTQAKMLAGVYFDIRLEIHAPINGSEAFNSGKPDDNFSFSISNNNGYSADVTSFFQIEQSPLEHWNFTYFEDLFQQDAKTPVIVNVAAKAYRQVAIYEPGNYTATLSYYGNQQTVAEWEVVAPATKPKTKNVILFIGDGMPQSAISAARLIGHKSINGKYQTRMQLDDMQVHGWQMTHSIDSFITDSANSATALYTGHKSTVNALNVYVDSSKSAYDDPKFETIAELFKRQKQGTSQVGIVSTAFIADATPVALVAHSRDRNTYQPLVEQYADGLAKNYSSWPRVQPDVIFGGGAEQFIAGSGSPNRSNYYDHFAGLGYNVIYDKTHLETTSNDTQTLGIFTRSNMAKWVDRNIYPQNLQNQKNNPTGGEGDAIDQPGLADMTLKAIDILKARDTEDCGFFLMAEAASIDKMFHVLDYERALGELLELDNAVTQTIDKLRALGIEDETTIIITADHGHGFDVFGNADTKYLKAQTEDRKKRNAVGVYTNSGLSDYQVANGSLPDNQTIVFSAQGPGWPVRWDPRYALAAGFGANPDHRETYATNTGGPRVPATNSTPAGDDYQVNPKDNPQGFTINGTLPVYESQGVHSLTDVPVMASGPGASVFNGVYNNIEIFHKMANILALGTTTRP